MAKQKKKNKIKKKVLKNNEEKVSEAVIIAFNLIDSLIQDLDVNELNYKL